MTYDRKIPPAIGLPGLRIIRWRFAGGLLLALVRGLG
jgi:hypothetical protein